MAKPKVIITVLAHGGFVHERLLRSIVNGILTPEIQSSFESIALRTVVDESPVSAARNRAVLEFLATDADWLMMIDFDIAPLAKFLNIVSLMQESGRFIATIAAPEALGSPHDVAFNLFKRDPHPEPGDIGISAARILPEGWSEWDFIGGGCLVCHRSVFEKMEYPYFRCVGLTELLDLDAGKVGGPYQPNEHGEEDFYFSIMARRAGFKLWAHSDYFASHFKQVNLLTLMF
jgi:hypothetical protein